MKRKAIPRSIALIAALMGPLTGCDRPPAPEAAKPSAAAAAPSNRVDIPAQVRRNLGITFAKVENRAVSRTLRVPGQFELMPTARREYRMAMQGKVEVLIDQYQAAEIGTPLYRLDSPRWRELQGQLVEARAAMRLAKASADNLPSLMLAHERHHKELEKAIELWDERIRQLEELRAAGTGRIDDLVQAKASRAAVSGDFAQTLEKEAELRAKGIELPAQLESAQARFALLLSSAAAMTGLTAEQLTAETGGQPEWRKISKIEVRALAPGVIESLHATNGAWLDENAPVATIVQPHLIRFRARALQSDLGRLENGLKANIVPPVGGTLQAADPMIGVITLAPTADGDQRTIELLVTPAMIKPWARAGVSGFMEVTVAGDDRQELAIPLSCIARDGTQFIIFRRDPKNPDKAIRMEADAGMDDGRWIVIKSGVKQGDEIVSDGVYQLMVATSGSITKGGHFHPDGSFHEGED